MHTLKQTCSVPHFCHLTSHNVFIDIKNVKGKVYSVNLKIGDLELNDFIEYGNLFYSYRITSAWSAPELLKQAKKMPADPSSSMDVYSFGMILWEMWHEALPFDSDVAQAIQYVVKEESRPKIIQVDDI